MYVYIADKSFLPADRKISSLNKTSDEKGVFLRTPTHIDIFLIYQDEERHIWHNIEHMEKKKSTYCY